MLTRLLSDCYIDSLQQFERDGLFGGAAGVDTHTEGGTDPQLPPAGPPRADRNRQHPRDSGGASHQARGAGVLAAGPAGRGAAAARPHLETVARNDLARPILLGGGQAQPPRALPHADREVYRPLRRRAGPAQPARAVRRDAVGRDRARHAADALGLQLLPEAGGAHTHLPQAADEELRCAHAHPLRLGQDQLHRPLRPRHERDHRAALLPRVPEVHPARRGRGLLHVLLPHDLPHRHAHQGYGRDGAGHHGAHAHPQQVSQGRRLRALEPAGGGEDPAAVLQFPVAGAAVGAGVRAVRDDEAVGRDAVLRRLQALLLPLLLLHQHPQVPQGGDPAARLHQHPALHSEAPRCQRQQDHRGGLQALRQVQQGQHREALPQDEPGDRAAEGGGPQAGGAGAAGEVDVRQHDREDRQFFLQDGRQLQEVILVTCFLSYLPAIYYTCDHFLRSEIGFTFRYRRSITPPVFIAYICHPSRWISRSEARFRAGPSLRTLRVTFEWVVVGVGAEGVWALCLVWSACLIWSLGPRNLMEGTLANAAMSLRVIACMGDDYYYASSQLSRYIVIQLKYGTNINTQGHFLGSGRPASQQSSSISAAACSSFTFSLQASQNSSSSSPFIMALMPNLVSPVRWSVILSCGQLQVRIFSLRSMVVTCDLRRDCSSSTDLRYSISKRRCLSKSVARFLFMSWLRSSWMKTCRPEGMWVARQADSILLTAWPPGPLDRVNWYLMSLGSTSKEKGTTGMTTMEMVLECRRPLASVSGTRITLCTPASDFITLCAPSPCTRMSRNLYPALTPDSFPDAVTQHFHPCIAQNASYISLRSFTKIELSAPPAPGRNSRMMSVAWSYFAGAISSPHSSSRIYASFSLLASISSCSSFFSPASLVSLIISLIWAMFSWWDLISSQAVRTGAS